MTASHFEGTVGGVALDFGGVSEINYWYCKLRQAEAPPIPANETAYGAHFDTLSSMRKRAISKSFRVVT